MPDVTRRLGDDFDGLGDRSDAIRDPPSLRTQGAQTLGFVRHGLSALLTSTGDPSQRTVTL